MTGIEEIYSENKKSLHIIGYILGALILLWILEKIDKHFKKKHTQIK